MATARWSAALAAAATAAAQAPTVWSSLGTTFDLTAMTQPRALGPYVLTDVRDSLTTYTFNFFTPVPPPALPAPNDAACIQWARDDNKFPALAWQVEGQRTYPQPVATQCYRMGSTNASQAWTWSLVGASSQRACIHPRRQRDARAHAGLRAHRRPPLPAHTTLPAPARPPTINRCGLP